MRIQEESRSHRILVIDDNVLIHEDFRKILIRSRSLDDELSDMESLLFGLKAHDGHPVSFTVDCASQGREGLEMLIRARDEDRPYALAFVDGRMPPGWDGVETVHRLWQECPDLQVVLCTAYADYAWREILRSLGERDSLLILKKPFDNIEVLQLAHALTRKWELNRQVRQRIESLGDMVRERTEETERTRGFLEAALEHSPVGIIISESTPEGISWANPAALTILNPPQLLSFENHAPGTGSDEHLYRPDGSCYLSHELPLYRATKKGEIIQNETFIIRDPRGPEKWISCNAAPIRDRDGTITSGIFTFIDITERQRAEMEREKLQAQLLQSQKMESLGVLAGGIAHDFNNLLQAMGGNIDLIRMQRQIDSENKDRLTAVAKAIDRAAQLVGRLLQFSRKAEAKRKQMDLNQEIRETVKILRRVLPKRIRIEDHLDPSGWPISADPMQVEQVLLNLGSNAADAMSEGGILTITTQNITADDAFASIPLEGKSGPYVLMTVTDTGCGMNSETLTHVFEPFFTTKEVGKGTGLGLSSVYGIVKGHEGHIHCVSKLGQGTSFEIYWPAFPGKVSEMASPSSRDPHLKGGSETILIVDDEAYIRELTDKALSFFGYNTLLAADGEEALAVVSEKGASIDLIILDLNMPGMDGHKCLESLLLLSAKPRVLVASGYSASGQAKELLEAGAAGFIGKPYKIEELVKRVREILVDADASDTRR